MAWAGAHPDRVGRLVLASTAPRFTDAIRRARADRAAEHRDQPYYADAMAALQAHLAGEYGTDEELARLYARESRVFVPVDMDTEEVDAVLMRAGTNADALRHFNDHVAGGMNLAPGLARVQAPTLVIAGDVDPIGAPAARSWSRRRRTAPGDRAGDHFPFLDQSTARSGRGRCSGSWERRVWL